MVAGENGSVEDPWRRARALMAGLPDGGLNISHEAADRHVAAGRGDVTALRWLGKDGSRRDISFAELAEQSGRFAGFLTSAGVEPGSVVAVLLGRVPELHVAALGALKAGAVVCPLFAAFGPEPIRERLLRGRARVLVTTPQAYRAKVAALRAELPDLDTVLLVGDGAADLEGALDFRAAIGACAPMPPVSTRPEDPALLHFTSGTTGRPKGALHVHEAAVMHAFTGRGVLGLRKGDVYWCTADPGWVTGTSYGIVAPLALGVTSVVDEGEFDPSRWCAILQDEAVTVWYTAPTAIRLLMRAGAEFARSWRYPALRHLASVGEPLTAEAVEWGRAAFGHPFHDTWWQTETGAIMVANAAGADPVPGSMGRPVEGIEAAVVRRDGDRIMPVRDGDLGELALRAGWPSMFRAYLDDDERYRACFVDGWYLSGDLARRDEQGHFWFVGRADDVIKSSGHLIGPFEVERVLMRHPAVAEAGVIGKPDAVAFEIVKAFVVLRPDCNADEAMRRDILAFARRQLGAAVAPKELAFADALPHTRSGKVLRRLLKANETGAPPGDLSTLEGRGQP